jgi:hypothetical protein
MFIQFLVFVVVYIYFVATGFPIVPNLCALLKIENGEIFPANKIYNEVIISTLMYNSQFQLIQKVKDNWIDASGNVDMSGLLKGFQQF